MKAINPLNAYKETQIKTANQGKLIIMLYDGAVKNINLAIDGIHKKHRKYDYVSNNVIKAQDIIAELMVSLDFDNGGEIAKNLFGLYVYMNRQLLEANLKKEEKPLVEVKRMLVELREAWVEVSRKQDTASGSQGNSGVNIAG